MRAGRFGPIGQMYWMQLFRWQDQVLESNNQILKDDLSYLLSGTSIPDDIQQWLTDGQKNDIHKYIHLRRKVKDQLIKNYNKKLKDKIMSDAEQQKVMYDVIMDIVSEYAKIKK